MNFDWRAVVIHGPDMPEEAVSFLDWYCETHKTENCEELCKLLFMVALEAMKEANKQSGES
jgi:hypothetical protein